MAQSFKSPRSTFDLRGIQVEGHVREALDEARQFAGPDGVDGRAVLLACVALAEHPRSAAFRTLADMLGREATLLADRLRRTKLGPSQSGFSPSLLDAFDRHRDALVSSGFWGRDLVTLALLDRADPSLDRLGREIRVDMEKIRSAWFGFVGQPGEHRAPAEWAAWWEAEGLKPPEAPPPVEQKVEAQAPVDQTAGSMNSAPDLSGDATVQGGTDAPSAPPVPGLADFDEPSWIVRLTPAAREVLASAWGLATYVSDGSPTLGVAHLLAAVASDAAATLDPVLQRVGVTRERFLVALTGPEAKPFPPSWPPMPVEAFPLLARDAREALIVAFGRAGAAAVDTPHLAEGALSVPRSIAVVRLGALGLTRASLPWAAPLPILQAGYRSDSASGEDKLGVLREARTLAAVMASNAVDPPLSIGLFGPWGSGKSFFMRILQEEVRRLAGSGSGGYCHNVVQIRFNAWHYIDGNLWASLASEVFEQLGREVEVRERRARGEEAGVQRARLLMAARQSRSALQEAEARRVELTDELERARSEVETLRGERWRERAASSAPRVAREAIERLGTEAASGLREDVHRALERLGLPADDLDPENVRRALSGWRRVRAWWQALRKLPPRQWLFLGVGLVVAILVASKGGVWMAALRGALGKAVSAVSLLVGALPALRAGYLRARAVLVEVKPVAEEFERFAGKVRTQLEEEDRARVELVLKQLETAKQREEAARARLSAVEEELATLFKADRLSSFVQERRKSRYYQAQLGIIAQARQDFEQLSRLLHTAGAPAEAGVTDADVAAAAEIAALRDGMPEVDRIILYIDDLDRCPEAQVVDVLQAVHLLLAFPLFVVVVGVDPRWLIHSLADRSEVFRAAETPLEGDGDGRHHWRSTPLDYLEKIFQIPFHLRPMGETGFGDLIDDITRDGPRAGGGPTAGAGAGAEESARAGHGAPEPTGDAAHAEDAAGAAGTGAERAPGQAGGRGDAPEGEAGEGAAASGEGGDATARDAEAVAEDAADGARGGASAEGPIPEPQLSIAPWERTFMKALYPFVTSPRAAKRYVNVYRLIRAAHIAPRLGPLFDEEAERDPSARDDHRTVLLLLAMLTGYPEQAIAFFRRVVEEGSGDTMSARVEALRAVIDREGAPPAPPAAPGLQAQGAAAENEPAGSVRDPLPASEWGPFLTALERGMAELRERGIEFEPAAEDLREWIPFVARYSFVSGQELRDG